MPRRVEPKSELVFRAAKARARSYLLADGNGLSLRGQPNGTKTWLFRYPRPSTGKENFISLGPYPDITLVDARRSATTARNLVREGADPVEHRRAESIARKRVVEGAFHLVAQRWLDACFVRWDENDSVLISMYWKRNCHTPNVAMYKRPTIGIRLTMIVAGSCKSGPTILIV